MPNRRRFEKFGSQLGACEQGSEVKLTTSPGRGPPQVTHMSGSQIDHWLRMCVTLCHPDLGNSQTTRPQRIVAHYQWLEFLPSEDDQ